MTPTAAMEVSAEAIEVMRQLLALHYIDGLPEEIAAPLQVFLRSVGAWFPDPQYAYHESQGYM
jgi:hypothetical protein